MGSWLRTRRCKPLIERGGLAITAELVVAVRPEVVTWSDWDIVYKRIEGLVVKEKEMHMQRARMRARGVRATMCIR